MPFACSIEIVWVRIRFRNSSLFVGAVYIPPERSSSLPVISQLHDCITAITEKLAMNDRLVLLGDFNLPSIEWRMASSPSHFIPRGGTAAAISFTDGADLNGLRQISGISNSYGRQLDLVLINDEGPIKVSPVRASPVPILAEDTHHPALEFTVTAPPTLSSLPAHHSPPPASARLCYSKCDLNKLRQLLQPIDWDFLDTANSIDDAVTMFTSTVTALLPLCCPRHRPPPSPAWSDRHLRALKTDLKRASRKYRKAPSSFSLRIFKYASSAYRRYNIARYHQYLWRMQARLANQPRAFWSFANSRRGAPTIPSSITWGDVEGSSPSEISNVFAKHFASLSNDPATRDLSQADGLRLTPRDVVTINAIKLTESDVLLALAKLKNSLSPGPDGIPASILKDCRSSFAPLLTRLFTRSLREGKYPRCWKTAFVVPIHKKGCRFSAANYRGISILSATAKTFEAIAHSFLLSCLTPILAPSQHGFVPKRSTSTNLMTLLHYLHPHLTNGHQVDVVYTDFSAAFDSIPHSLLTAKLERLGVGDSLLAWLTSFLSERTSRVRVGDSLSPPFPLLSGVPQGSVLSPLLFALFANDCSFILPAQGHLLYADDIKFLHPISSPSDPLFLQKVIDEFCQWCASNGLILSPSKCCVISFGRSPNKILWSYKLSGRALNRVHEIRDLGVVLDDTLSFRTQVDEVVRKASKALGLVMRMSAELRDPVCLRALYCAWVRPSLDYASVVWSPQGVGAIARLEGVQRKFTRMAVWRLRGSTVEPMPPYLTRCRMLRLPSVEVRHSHARALLIANLLLHNLDAPTLLAELPLYAPSRPLRDRPPLHIQRCRTQRAQRDPWLRALSSFNDSYVLFDFHRPVTNFRARLINSVV